MDQVALILAGRKSQVRRLATSPLHQVQPGDRLWVQEAFAPVIIGGDRGSGIVTAKPGDASCAILRDGWQQSHDGSGRAGPLPAKLGIRLGWYQAVHMPRWASRLDLIVADVRIESLQSISEADARAEGFVPPLRLWPKARARFSRAWDKIRGTPGERWDDNPEVVVLSFTRLG